MLKVGDEIAEQLAAEGVQRTFGLLGAGTLRIVGRLTHELGIPFHGARHEAGAVSMADGHARVTGEPAVCIVSQGPGTTNTITPLVTARKARTPLVLLAASSEGARADKYPFGVVQALDQERVLASIDVPSHRITASSAREAVAAAIAQARREKRPVALELPAELQHADGAGGPAPPAARPAAPAPPDPGALDAVAAALAGARRPVVLAGLGAVESGGREALCALAGELGALLATTLRAGGYFDGEPFAVGYCGGYATPEAQTLLARADAVVAFGASLNSFTTSRGKLVGPDALVVQCDADPDAFGRHGLRPAHAVVGDARLAAEGLVERLRQGNGHGPGGARPEAGYRTPEAAAVLASATREPVRTEPYDDGTLDPAAICARLDELLPRKRLVVTDGGHSILYAVDHVRVPDPRALVHTIDFGTTGAGLGSAIGAALGRPDHVCALFIGDGGLMMTLGELDSAVRARVPMLVVVLDDRAYGSEVHIAWRLGLSPDDAIFETPDFVDVARSLGAHAVRLSHVDELERVVARLDGLDRPLVVHCPIPLTAQSRILEELK